MKGLPKSSWIFIAILVCVGMITGSMPSVSQAFSNAVIEVGAKGSDVAEMQGRLKFLGFYNGKVDGQFGWQSYWSLRNFQYEFGMDVDGKLGSETKLKLYNASKNWRPGAEFAGTPLATPSDTGTTGGTTGGTKGATADANAGAGGAQANDAETTSHTGGYSDNDIRLMANAVYGESRGEPYEGQVAVASVILNRTRAPGFPKTPSGVIFEPLAFTAVADGQIWLTPNEVAKKAVKDAIKGWDPTDGCTYYFNPETATSAWIWSRPQVKKIGRHIFCR